MKTRKMLFWSVILSVILLLGMVMPVSAEATRKEVSAVETSCGNGWEKMWMDGQVMHIRNFVHTNRLISADAELNGINTTVADAQINLMNGNGLIKGTWSLKPDSINGTWEGTWLSIGTKGLGKAWAVGQGKGELSGKMIFLEISGDPSNTDTSQCAGLGTWEGNYTDVGYILENGQP